MKQIEVRYINVIRELIFHPVNMISYLSTDERAICAFHTSNRNEQPDLMQSLAYEEREEGFSDTMLSCTE